MTGETRDCCVALSRCAPSAGKHLLLKRLSAAIIVLLLLACPAPSIAKSGTPCCVQSRIAADGDVKTCGVPMISCNGQCTDTQSDPQNCGGCFSACADGACVAGACQCSPDRTLCPASGSSQVCADLMDDNNNCGMCGRVCDAKTCIYGACVCPRGQTLCGDRCVDLQNDNNNCGVCGRHCRVDPRCRRRKSGCATCENGNCVAF
jgi:hypothetical protein